MSPAPAARIHGGVHFAGRAVQLLVEFLFEAAEAVVVHAHVAEHLRGDLVVGIEALKLLLEVDALHVEGAHARCNFGVTRRAIQAKLCPAARRAAISLSVVRTSSGSVWTMAARVCAAAFLSSISRGVGVDGVDLHGHGQLVQVAVVEHAAAGSYLKGALLLPVGALNVFLVVARSGA